MSKENASDVKEATKQVNTQSEGFAAFPVALRIVGIRKSRKVDVYCMSVEKNKNFVANGIVISNCDALRYAAYTHFYKSQIEQATPAELQRLEEIYRPRLGIQSTY